MAKTKVYRRGKKRCMTKFMIGELSAVDFPAQEGAQSVLLKRRDTSPSNEDVEKSSDALVLATSEEGGHGHSIRVYPSESGGTSSYGTNASDEPTHDHPWAFTEDGAIKVVMNAGHTHTVERDALVRAFRALKPSLRQEDSAIAMARKCRLRFEDDGDIIDIIKQEEVSMTPEELKALQDRLAVAEKAAEDAQAALKAKQDADDEAARKAAEVEKAAEGDSVVYTADNGDIFKASDDPRLVKMAQERDAERKQLAQERAINKQRDFEKRADDTLDSLPGDVSVRAAIVKAIDGIEDEAVKQHAAAAIIAGNEALKGAFVSTGHGDARVVSDANSRLDQLAKARASESNVDYFTAYEQVADENPDLANQAITGAN